MKSTQYTHFSDDAFVYEVLLNDFEQIRLYGKHKRTFLDGQRRVDHADDEEGLKIVSFTVLLHKMG